MTRASGFDPRITAARADLAAASLRGQVDAARFVEGRRMQVGRGVVALRAAPDAAAGLNTQLLYGEHFTVYDESAGWAWGQAAGDLYVGYVRTENLTAPMGAPTHRVSALGTPLLTGPDVKCTAADMLPMNAKLRVAGEEGRFARLENGLYIFVGHLAPLADAAPDWVAVAERFAEMPYLWGGKTAAGLDCSGLVQTALEAGGRAAPRDTDMMQAALGAPVAATGDLSGLRRGDLVFWKGHMGVMRNPVHLLHANAYFMQVTNEPLAAAAARIAEGGLAVSAIKRL